MREEPLQYQDVKPRVQSCLLFCKKLSIKLSNCGAPVLAIALRLKNKKKKKKICLGIPYLWSCIENWDIRGLDEG